MQTQNSHLKLSTAIDQSAKRCRSDMFMDGCTDEAAGVCKCSGVELFWRLTPEKGSCAATLHGSPFRCIFKDSNSANIKLKRSGKNGFFLLRFLDFFCVSYTNLRFEFDHRPHRKLAYLGVRLIEPNPILPLLIIGDKRFQRNRSRRTRMRSRQCVLFCSTSFLPSAECCNIWSTIS